jgi:hypothetical protein
MVRGRIPRWLLLPLLSLLALGAPVLLAPPAVACSCAPATASAQFSRADAVFVGTVVERRVPDSDPYSSTAPAVYVVDVDRVYKGRVTVAQEVVTAVSGASCGLEVPAGAGPVLFYADLRPGTTGSLRPGQLSASLCGGTRSGAAPAAFGAGRLPEREPATPPGTPPGTPPAAADPPAGDGGVPPVAVVALAGAAVLGGGLVAGARLRSRRRAAR